MRAYHGYPRGGLAVLFETEATWDLFVFNLACYGVIVLLQRFVDVWLPNRTFDPSHRRYRAFKWERAGGFYRDVLKIDRWKDKLPCIDARTHFSKKSLAGQRADYLEQFVVETCRSESSHVTMILWVGAMRLWTPFDLWLLCFVLAVVGNLPFICIQRYNRPRLQHALAHIEERRIASGYLPRPALQSRADVQGLPAGDPAQPEPHSYYAT